MLAITRNAIAGTSSTAASLVRTFQFRGDRLLRDRSLGGSGASVAPAGASSGDGSGGRCSVIVPTPPG